MWPRVKAISLVCGGGLLFLTALGGWGCGDDSSTDGAGASASTSTTSAVGPSATGSGVTSATTGSAVTGTSAAAGGGIGPDAPECALPAPPPDPVCEAAGGGHCYYLDATHGDDAGEGTFESPWRSLANVVSYYGTPGESGSTPKPDKAIDLGPGDVVYLRAGTYSDVYNYQGYLQVAMFRGIDGNASAPVRLVAYPGEVAVVDPAHQGEGVRVLQSSHWQIEGLEIAHGQGTGLRLEEVDTALVSHVTIHDCDGVDNDNISGLYLVGSSDVEVACSVLHDNYDHENADTGGEATENSTDMVAFSGGNLRVHHNAFYQTPSPDSEKTGGCLKYKHAANVPDAVFEVDHNVLRSCKFFAIGTGTQHSHVHHNVIEDGAGISSRDFGGPTHQTDQRFEYNTLYHAGGIDLSPTTDWNDGDFSSPEAISFTHNVVFEDSTVQDQEEGTVVIGTYASDALYDATTPELDFETNCYFNVAGGPHFALFAANGGSYGVEGDQFDFDGWKALALGYDADSLQMDPGFVNADQGDFSLGGSSACAAMGAYATE